MSVDGGCWRDCLLHWTDQSKRRCSPRRTFLQEYPLGWLYQKTTTTLQRHCPTKTRTLCHMWAHVDLSFFHISTHTSRLSRLMEATGSRVKRRENFAGHIRISRTMHTDIRGIIYWFHSLLFHNQIDYIIYYYTPGHQQLKDGLPRRPLN